MTGIRRIGHAGTLDPFADGLLLVVIGKATAIVQFMENYDKAYELGVEFGRATDSFDLTGNPVPVPPVGGRLRENLCANDFAAVKAAVAALEGERLQTPPMYSAVKVAGKPLYTYARRGEEIGRPARPVRVAEATVLSVGMGETLQARLLIRCSKGTYIRSLADDLGRSLGTGAVAVSLKRLACGPFKLEQALDLEDLQHLRDSCADADSFVEHLEEQSILLPMAKAFAGFPAMEVSADAAERLINGQRVILAEPFLSAAGLLMREGEPAETSLVKVSCQQKLIAVARLILEEPGQFRLKTERVLINLADFRQT
jgi:tRNA pseudouridine55 synthase